MHMSVVCSAGSKLSCALIAIGIAATLLAILAPYTEAAIVAGPHHGAYVVILLVFFVVMRRFRRVPDILIGTLCWLLLSFPLSFSIYIKNGSLYFDGPEKMSRLLFSMTPDQVIFALAFNCFLLLILYLLLSKLSWQTASKTNESKS